jgi:hypothetical protein
MSDKPRHLLNVMNRTSPPPRRVADRHGNGLLLADEHDQLLAPGNTCIQQISLQHGVVLRHDRDGQQDADCATHEIDQSRRLTADWTAIYRWGSSGSHLPSFRYHYRLLGYPFHQRDFMKWALLNHGQCCCIKFLPPFVTSGLI